MHDFARENEVCKSEKLPTLDSEIINSYHPQRKIRHKTIDNYNVTIRKTRKFNR